MSKHWLLVVAAISYGAGLATLDGWPSVATIILGFAAGQFWALWLCAPDKLRKRNPDATN